MAAIVAFANALMATLASCVMSLLSATLSVRLLALVATMWPVVWTDWFGVILFLVPTMLHRLVVPRTPTSVTAGLDIMESLASDIQSLITSEHSFFLLFF